MNPALVLAIILAANALAFSPLLGSGMEFLGWDDTANIVDQPTVNTWSFENLVSAWNARSVVLGVYEPFGVMLKLVTVKLFGLHVRPFHVITLLIHVANALLVYWLALHLLRRCDTRLRERLHPELAALTASLLFSLNPMRVEVVAWASGQSYALAALFFLTSLALYVRYCEQRADGGGRPALTLSLSVVVYAAALLSKSAAIFLPPVLLVVDFFPFRRKPDLSLLVEKIPHGIVGCVLFAIIWSTTADVQGIMSFELDLTARIAYAINALPFHLWKSLWPADVHPSYAVVLPDVGPASGPLLFSTLFVAAICVLAWALRRRAAWFGAAWLFFVLGILPVSGLFAHGNWLLGADRYAYMSTVALWIVLGAISTSRMLVPEPTLRNARTRVTALLLCLLIATWGATTRRVVTHWSKTESLWHYTLELDPANATALNNLGYFYMSKQRYEEGLPYFSSAIRVDPGNLKPVLNLGVSLHEMGRYDEATYTYLNALRIHPRAASLYNNLGVTSRAMGRHDVSEQYFQRARDLKAEKGAD